MSLSKLGLNWGKIGVFSNGGEGDMGRREGNITSLCREGERDEYLGLAG